MDTRSIGRIGEEMAVKYLIEHKKARILARNFTVRGGEIDIVAEIDDVIAFVEVKLRTHSNPHEAIGYTKQKRLSRAALAYIQRYGLEERIARFDALLIRLPDEIEYIESAFEYIGS